MKHSCQILGTTTNYWEYNPDKPTTLILIHGFRGTHHGLLKIAEQLPEYRLIIPDLPGFGVSEALLSGHSIDDYVEWLYHFRQIVDPSTPSSYIVGHSFGSIIVSHYGALNPSTVNKLTLINPIGAPALEGEQRLLTQLAILYYWLGRKLPARAARAWISLKPITKVTSITMRKTKDREVRKFIDEQHYTHFSTFANPTQLSEAFKTSVSHDVSQVADHLTMPTLMIVGEKDDITALTKQHELHAKLSDGELVIIPDVGHLTHYETPGQVANAIRNFIQ
jgi:pimeloyl-ACP methyl ester carboxylesterase